MRPAPRACLGGIVVAALGMALTAPPAAAMAAAEGAQETSVTITRPSDGSFVAGVVAVVSEASANTSSVTFAVSTDEALTWSEVGVDTDGSDGWSAVWESHPYSGPALLQATATDGVSEAGDEVSVVADNAAPTVRLSVSRHAFSPNGDGKKDTTVLKAQTNEPTLIRIEILDREDRVLRRWSSRGATTSFTARWQGRASQRRLRDGVYRIRAHAEDAVGYSSDARRSVVIDTRAPRFASLRISRTLFTQVGTLRTSYKLRDRAQRFRVQLQIADRLGVIRRIRHGSRKQSEIAYKTRYGNGAPLHPGRYSARVRVSDDAGNTRLSDKKLWVMRQPVRAKIFERLANVGRRVALTFDDCNHPDAWDRILRTLANFRVKATFFCSGQQVLVHRDVAKRTVREGHAIGSHGWDHALLSGRSQSETEWRIRADARLWWGISRDTTASLYRPAYGGYDRNVLAAAGATGHGRVVMWDVDSLDYATSSPNAISSRVLREARPGSIILVHVLDQTAAALPAILRGLAQRDLLAVDLHRLFRAAGYR